MVEEGYLQAVLDEFRRYRSLAERAIAPLRVEDLAYAPDPESNSILVLMRHVGGNLRSRWTDVLTSDGEKPDRDRDAEFEAGTDDEAAVRALWQAGWQAAVGALEALDPGDLGAVVTIRAEPHTLVRAIERSVAHTAYHVGQIVYLAKHLQKERWHSLSIPRGQSARFAADLRRTHGQGAADAAKEPKP